jgi:RNA polymerase sigma-70 factor (ECF subfamily)
MGDDGRKEKPVRAAGAATGRDRTAPGPIEGPVGDRPGTDPTGRSQAADLEAVYREHADTVLRAAYRVTGRMSDAEDVLQTVFLRLVGRSDRDANAPALELGPGAGAYLRRAAINAALDVIRSRKRRRAVDLDGESAPQLPDEAPDPERHRAGRERRDALRRALARLGTSSPKAAEVFTLRFFEGLGNKEIARLLAMSQTAVAVTLHRTRSKLRQELGSLEGGLS